MVISGDFHLPDILWDSIDSASGVNEPAFLFLISGFFMFSYTRLNPSQVVNAKRINIKAVSFLFTPLNSRLHDGI